MNALQQIEAKLRGVQCADPECDSLIGAVLEIAREALAKPQPEPMPESAITALAEDYEERIADLERTLAKVLRAAEPLARAYKLRQAWGAEDNKVLCVRFLKGDALGKLHELADVLAAIPAAHERQSPNAIAGEQLASDYLRDFAEGPYTMDDDGYRCRWCLAVAETVEDVPHAKCGLAGASALLATIPQRPEIPGRGEEKP